MIEPGPATQMKTHAQRHAFIPAANLVGGEHATLVLDQVGRICACDDSVEEVLGSSRGQLVGRRICEFIAGLPLGGSSPSYCARYLVYLCGGGEWRKFEAQDGVGTRFAIELNLSRQVTDGQENFLLNVRRAHGLMPE